MKDDVHIRCMQPVCHRSTDPPCSAVINTILGVTAFSVSLIV